MPTLRPALLALFVAGSLPACATPAAAPAPATAEEAPMNCNADPGRWAVGLAADKDTLARLRADTGAQRVRVIRPGMAVTMDFREDRLNLDVDADNRILAVRCG